VIPTRNRAELAERAVAALLDEPGDDLRVVVSDNSTDEPQAVRLAGFCSARRDARLTYLRAPDLTMPAHWNWALERALACAGTSHFSIHYDRKVAKPGQMRHLFDAIARHPDHVVTYTIDWIQEQAPRWVLWQAPTTGRSYEVETARVRRMTCEGRIAEMGQAFPILSNCAVPRPVLERIRDRFGDICDSTGPDVAFTFRHCALEKSYLHLDRSLAVTHGIRRSNAAGYLSGKRTDFEDFKRAWGDRAWLDAVPIPGVNLGWNILFHEYELVRRAVGGEEFPPLSMAGYLDGLAHGLSYIEDDRVRREYETLLEGHGWRRLEADEPAPAGIAERGPYQRGVLAAKRLLVAGRARAVHYARRQSLVLFLASALRILPERITGFTFGSERSALRFAMRCPRRCSADHEYLDWMLAGDEVGAPDQARAASEVS
jgi:hypothetical protein